MNRAGHPACPINFDEALIEAKEKFTTETQRAQRGQRPQPNNKMN
jgi:hypothetical protein